MSPSTFQTVSNVQLPPDEPFRTAFMYLLQLYGEWYQLRNIEYQLLQHLRAIVMESGTTSGAEVEERLREIEMQIQAVVQQRTEIERKVASILQL